MGNKNNTIRIAIRAFEPFETAIHNMWSSYCEQTGCTIQLEAVSMELDTLHREILTKKGLKKGYWDIALINTDWLTEAYASESIETITHYIEDNPPEDYPEGWSDSLLEMQKFGEGEIVGLPFHDGPECLIYRKDLFEHPDEQRAYAHKYGKELHPPQTWSDFRNIARFFQRPEKNLFGSVFAAYPDGHNTVFDFCLQLWTRGGTLTDADGTIDINIPAAHEGLEFYRDILQDDSAVHPGCADFDSVKSGLAFAKGEGAMMVNWFGFAAFCDVNDESKIKGKVDVTTIPRGASGTAVSLNVYWLYSIGAGSSKKDIAYDFLRFATSPANDKRLTMAGGIGCRLSTWHDPEVNQVVPYYHRLEELHKNAKALPRRNDWAEIASVIDSVVIDVLNTGQSVSAILEKGQQKINRLMS